MDITRPHITVSILLRGDQLDPDYISTTLGIQPSDSQKKGEKRGGIQPNSKEYLTRIGIWRIWVESELRTMSELVHEILKKFDIYHQPLDRISGVHEAYLDILILQDKENKLESTAEFVLSRDQVSRINQLGLALWVTVSFNDD